MHSVEGAKKNFLLYNEPMKTCLCQKNLNRRSLIHKYYHPRLSDGDYDHEKLGWESREAQFRRFEVVLDKLGFRDMTILDVGCGLGNLLDFCQMKDLSVHYTGVDILPDMIENASRRHPDARWYCCDLFSENRLCHEKFDLIYSSGIFNLDLGNNSRFLMDALELFLDLSKRYVCFNLLSDSSPDQEKGYYYYSENKVLEDILKKFTLKEHNISIESDYLENDFTVMIKKQ